jgi:hypothetical protein
MGVKMLKAEVQMAEEKRPKKTGRIIKWPKPNAEKPLFRPFFLRPFEIWIFEVPPTMGYVFGWAIGRYIEKDDFPCTFDPELEMGRRRARSIKELCLA